MKHIFPDKTPILIQKAVNSGALKGPRCFVSILSRLKNGVLRERVFYVSGLTKVKVRVDECLRRYSDGRNAVEKNLYLSYIAGYYVPANGYEKKWYPAWSRLDGLNPLCLNEDVIDIPYFIRNHGLSVLKDIDTWNTYPMLEMFRKLKLTEHVKALRLAEKDKTFRKFLYAQAKEGLRNSDTLLLAYKKKLSYDFLSYAKENHLPMTKEFESYSLKHKDDMSFYHDYLKLLDEAGVEKTHDRLFPSDIKRSHDYYVEVINDRKLAKNKEELDSIFKKFNRILKKYKSAESFTDGNYCFVIPRCFDDFVNEGRNNHNCVGGSLDYPRRMSKGQSLILFCRKVDDKDNTFVTVEINLNSLEVAQCYAKFDSKPDQSVVDFVQSYVETIK